MWQIGFQPLLLHWYHQCSTGVNHNSEPASVSKAPIYHSASKKMQAKSHSPEVKNEAEELLATFIEPNSLFITNTYFRQLNR